MQYKTIVLHLLEQQPKLYHRLRKERQLLPALERYAHQLKTFHNEWQETLRQARPQSEQSQLSSEALELALKDLEECLPTASERAADKLSLDEVMAQLRNRSPRE